MKPKGTAIVGSGFAGLAAAVVLAENGRAPVVFEAARHAGGRARRVCVAGQSLDNGQHILLGAYHDTLGLIEKVSPGATTAWLLRQRLRVHRRDGFLLSVGPWPAPWHMALALFNCQGVSLAERLSALRFALQLRCAGFRAPTTMTVAELLKGQPARLIAELWEPLCLAALNTPIAIASAQIFLNVLARAFAANARDSDFLLPRVELARLFVEPAAAYVETHGGQMAFGKRVSRLRPIEGGWAVSASTEEFHFAQVIVAVAPQQLAGFASACPALAEIARDCARNGYQPIHTIYLQFTGRAKLAEPILALDGNPGQWLIDRGQLGGNPGLMAVVISASAGQPSGAALAAATKTQLSMLYPELGTAQWARCIAERHATYTCRPTRRLPPLKPAPGLYLAGDYCHPAFPGTIEAAVRSGLDAAGAALDPKDTVPQTLRESLVGLA